jgi:YD repeat-containing protein
MTLKRSLGSGMAGLSRLRWNMCTSLRIAILGALLYSAGAASPALSATRYTYDGINRLIQVAYDDGSVIQYSYDANGNRLTSKVTGVTGGTDNTITGQAADSEGAGPNSRSSDHVSPDPAALEPTEHGSPNDGE